MEESSRCTCCFFRDPDKDGDDPCKGCCSLPKPKRQTPPLGYHKYELRECFPCYYYSSYLVNKFPFVKWLIRYNARWLLSDIIAGLTVGLMVVPQGLAYANIARLPPRVSQECIDHSRVTGLVLYYLPVDACRLTGYFGQGFHVLKTKLVHCSGL